MESRQEAALRVMAEWAVFKQMHSVQEREFLQENGIDQKLFSRLRRYDSVSTRTIEKLGTAMRKLDPDWAWP